MADVTMPQLGETVTEGTITKWFKQVGDKVDPDEVLFEVSTDKVDSEVPSPAGGFIAEILVPEGETVDVGTKLAVISDSAPAGGSAPAQEASAPEAPAPAPEPAPAPAPEPERAPAAAPEPEPAPAPPPAPAPAAPTPAAPAPAAAKPAGDGDGKVLSPVVRKLLNEHELDPSEIEGTGAGGRITRADVLAHIDKTKSAPQPAAAAAPAAPAPAAVPSQPAAAAPSAPAAPAAASAVAPSPVDDEVVPFSNIRKRTAEHMVRSLATSAHVLTAVEVDFENVDRVRRAHREEFKEREGTSLTYLPFIARTVVDTIEEFPHVNASVGDNELIVHHRIHLGIAVDLSFEGLIVPVVHDADGKRMRALAREIADLAARARNRKLGADDISGGTFTITNPGPFGTFITAPVINQPQVAILSTDGVKKRPVAIELPDGSDGIAVHPVGLLALSFDHRAFDGAYASAFLNRCREILETRDWETEL
jgi:2-oxoglutarate dehydrogenase E2 component (dihydrolipoamide succinyltransferase)